MNIMSERLIKIAGNVKDQNKQEGMDAEAVACHIKQQFPNLPIILLSAYCEMRERVLVVSG